MEQTSLAKAMGLFGLAAALAACGGGGGTPAAQTQSLQGVVADGPLQGATACYDLNDNNSCDTGEPATATASDADGKFTLIVPAAEAGKHATIVNVPATAVDKDTGAPIGVAVMLTTPATGTSSGALFVSPLTTAVHQVATSQGLAVSDAAAQVQTQLQLTGSPLANFVAIGDAQAARAGSIMMAVQMQVRALASAAGVTSSQGQALVDATVAAALPRVGDSLNSEDTPAQAAGALLAAQGLNEDTVAQRAELAEVIASGTREVESVPTPGASLRWFTYTDATHWYYRMFSASEEQIVVVEGKTRFSEERRRMRGGPVEVWGETEGFISDVVWFNDSTSTWAPCPANTEHKQTVRNAQGVNESFYCGVLHARHQSTFFDISGQPYGLVMQTMRAFPMWDPEGNYAFWGPDPALPLLAEGSFPEGSKLRHMSSTDLKNADAYYSTTSVFSYFSAITEGDSSQCLAFTPATATNFGGPATSLEGLIAGAKGIPCVFTPNETSGPRHEWWGNSSIGVALRNVSPGPNPYYRAQRNLRVSFGPGNAISYWDCAIRDSDGSPRNCNPAGTGTYGIEQHGDARVLRLSAAPASWSELTYTRTYVQHNDKVYVGFKDELDSSASLRLNKQALEALFTKLGIPLD